MAFGFGRKMDVYPTFDRAYYNPGDVIQIVAHAHGETPDRVRGGKASLYMRLELRNARGIAPGKTNMAGTWGEQTKKGETALQQIAPAPDGTPRVAGQIVVPGDATPSEETANRTIEWLVRVDVARKGSNRGRLVPITVLPVPR